MNTMYRCADGAWVVMTSHDQRGWPAFCTALGHPELGDDPRYATAPDRFAHRAALVAVLDEVFGSQPFDYWVPRLDESGVIWSRIAELPELIEDPQARRMGMFAELEHPDLGRFETLAAPFSFEHSDVEVRGPAPEVGQHTAAVLAELDRSTEAIDALAHRGVVTRPPDKTR